MRIAPVATLLLAIAVSTGCATTAPAPAAAVIASPPLSTNPGPPVTTANDGPRITVEPGAVLFNGQLVGATGAVAKIDGLYDRLKAEPKESGAPATYTLVVADDVKMAGVKSVVQTAAFAGWSRARLDTGSGTVELRALPLPPGIATNSELAWPDKVLVLAVREKAVEVWRQLNVPPQGSQPGESSPTRSREVLLQSGFATVGVFQPETMGPILDKECSSGDTCSPALLFAANNAEFSVARRGLAMLAQSAAENGVQVTVQLRIPEPSPTGPGPRAILSRSGQHLPPTVIQERVRAEYDRLRACYESGLARDPALRGRVSVRFVIEHDGKVGDIKVQPDSTLPDPAAVQCMVDVYKTLRFPERESGTVTVVYPINFQPGDDAGSPDAAR